MRKPVHERSTPIKLHELTDDTIGVTPYVEMRANSEGVIFDRKYENSRGTHASLTISDPEVVCEVCDQLGAWTEQHSEAGDDE